MVTSIKIQKKVSKNVYKIRLYLGLCKFTFVWISKKAHNMKVQINGNFFNNLLMVNFVCCNCGKIPLKNIIKAIKYIKLKREQNEGIENDFFFWNIEIGGKWQWKIIFSEIIRWYFILRYYCQGFERNWHGKNFA